MKIKRHLSLGVVTLFMLLAGIELCSCSSKKAELTQEEQLAELKSQVNSYIMKDEYDSAFLKLDEINNFIEINHIERSNYSTMVEDSYLKLVITLIREGDLEGAAMVGLDYRTKLNDQAKWENSEIYKVLIQECEAQNVDDAPLR